MVLRFGLACSICGLDILFIVKNKYRGKKQAGISFLLIDMKTDGIKVNPIISIDNHHSLNEVEFVDVRVPKKILLVKIKGGPVLSLY